METATADVFLSRKFVQSFQYEIIDSTSVGDNQAQVVAIRLGDWKTVFYENRGRQFGVWMEPFTELRIPLLFNLRRDPYEKVAEESGLYTGWLGHKMWAFGPTKRLVQQHLATFKMFPPRRPSASSNAKEMTEKARHEHGFAQ